MERRIKENTMRSSAYIFIILLVVHAFEALCLRLDESIFAENFLNKVFGIIVIFCVLRWLKWKWPDIGFSKKGFVRSVLIGLALGICTFFVAYALEIMILKQQGHQVSIAVCTTAFSLVGETAVNTGAGYILMCIFFNIINVVMEEGVFRGLFYQLVSLDHTRKTAIMFQCLLFGVWHMITPLRNLIDGDFGVASFVGLSLGYVVLAGFMGIKWSLLYRMTGNLYAGMADHFFNNCIASNLLHVSTESGMDELMILRIVIAQILSLILVLIVFRFKDNKQAY